jgi:hypothetical protein
LFNHASQSIVSYPNPVNPDGAAFRIPSIGMEEVVANTSVCVVGWGGATDLGHVIGEIGIGGLERHTSAIAQIAKRIVTDLCRLVTAVADGGHSEFLIEAIAQREQELQILDERVNA